MKKAYKKPLLFAEPFALVEHISQTCAFVTNFGNQCPIADAGVIFFTSMESGCNEDGISMLEFAGVVPADATVEDLINKVNPKCYNSLQDYHQLFTS